MKDREKIDRILGALEAGTPLLDGERLRGFVGSLLAKKELYLNAHEKGGSPLYLFDEAALVRKIREFKAAFREEIPGHRVFYALKSNSHPFLAETVVKEGCGIDVSSGLELEKAMEQDPEAVIFSGPGKTLEELALACRNAGKVTVLLDSFGEMDRLEEAAAREGVTAKAGVRLTNEEKGLWRKFGIPLTRLPEFFEESRSRTHIDLCGLQFHSSWNMDPERQTAFIARVGETLSRMKKDLVGRLRFLDIGGGYWPSEGEWLQSAGTAEGRVMEAAGCPAADTMKHFHVPSAPITVFARDLAAALEQHIFPYAKCVIYLEPGRWFSHEAMHILLKVVDKKAPDVVVCDGGVNMTGWERYELDYFPVINLSRPSLEESPCMVFGSLCNPHDIWGYSYFGNGIEPGDILLVPRQGAYTYSLRQEFIKPVPLVVRL